MSIYDQPTKDLMREFAKSELTAGQVFDKATAVRWFATHYPKIRPGTVQMHVEGMSVNSSARKHHPNVHAGSGHDFFFKVGPGRFRLWDPKTDPAPRYGDDFREAPDNEEDSQIEETVADGADETASAFAAERDLQNYLAKNPSALEPGLRVYQEEGLSGVEYPAGGGRRIDILAVDKTGDFVVVELKVSKGYDRVVGQIMRYMAWVKMNLADGQSVRGIIVAAEITEDLKLAASLVEGVTLVEYELSFRLKTVK